MADMSEFDAMRESKSRGPRCTVCILVDPATTSLDSARLESLQVALATDHRGGGYSHATIIEVLAGWGFRFSGDTVGRHRRRLCK